MTLVSVFQVSNFLSYSHYKIKGTYEKKTDFGPEDTVIWIHKSWRMSFSIICMSMTAHSVFIAKTNLNIEPQTIFTAVLNLTNLYQSCFEN